MTALSSHAMCLTPKWSFCFQGSARRSPETHTETKSRPPVTVNTITGSDCLQAALHVCTVCEWMIIGHDYCKSASFCVSSGLNPVEEYSDIFDSHLRAGVTGCCNNKKQLLACYPKPVNVILHDYAAIYVTPTDPWVWMIDKLRVIICHVLSLSLCTALSSSEVCSNPVDWNGDGTWKWHTRKYIILLYGWKG